jgi:hypothetical protein
MKDNKKMKDNILAKEFDREIKSVGKGVTKVNKIIKKIKKNLNEILDKDKNNKNNKNNKNCDCKCK